MKMISLKRTSCAPFGSLSVLLAISLLVFPTATFGNEDNDDVASMEEMRSRIEEKIRLEDTMSTRPFRYYRRVYRQLRKELKGVKDDDMRTTWNVRATRVGKCQNDTLTFSHWRRSNNSIGPDHVTRVELLLPVSPSRRSTEKDVTVVVKGEEISSQLGTVEVNNLLVFNLTNIFQEYQDIDQSNLSAQVEMKFDHCHAGVYRRHAFILVYFNIPNTVLDTFRERSLGKHKLKAEKAKRRVTTRSSNHDKRSSNRDKRSSEKKMMKPRTYLQACHVKKLMVDPRRLNSDVLFPYALNIGYCEGSCAHVTNFNIISRHVTGHAVLLHQYNRVYGKRKPYPSCVPHTMKGELLMVNVDHSFELIFFHNALVTSCRCA